MNTYTVGFISLGCAKNLVDAQNMAGALLKDGITLARSPEEADVILVNTCAFIHDAREESLDAIRAACRLKAEGACRAVVVAGCFPQRYGRGLQKELPDVDAFLGIDQILDIGKVIRRLASGKRWVSRIPPGATRLFDPPLAGLSFSGSVFAYIKIAEGCNHPCAFCAIPAIRGNYRSRPIDRIAAEAGTLLENGFRELNFVSQDTTYYGKDLHDGSSLPALLRAVSALGGAYWIRLLYGYPAGISRELLDVMAATPRVCRYLDVPIQHSHPDVLRAMKRGNTADAVAEMAARARAALPGVTLRTTCLVGFPGETEEHFAHLLRHVREAKYDHVGVFAFSPEEKTPAFRMPGRPAPELAEERRERLMLAQQEVLRETTPALAGKETTVLLEHRVPRTKGQWEGRSERYAPTVDGKVTVRGVPDNARPGTFILARYLRPHDYDMSAVFVSNKDVDP